ncbi:MAG: type IV pilin protein [Bdellovibrionales bacterium]
MDQAKPKMTSSALSAQLGFSAVEMMVVVAILGILAVISIADFSRLATRAKYKRALADLSGISTMIEGHRVTEEKFLLDITGSGCTAWCLGNSAISWNRIGYDTVPLDPWGNQYYMEENENEGGPGDARHDTLFCIGADRIISSVGFGDGQDVFGDDMIWRVPWYAPHAGGVPLGKWNVGAAWDY